MRYFVVVVLFLAGCHLFPPRIHTKAGTRVTPPANAQAPTTVDEGTTIETVPIPTGSKITVTETPATADRAAQKVTELVMSGDSERRTETKETRVSVAPPRAPDQTVALKKVANSERRPLLYLAILLLAGAGVGAYFHLASLTKLAAIGAGVCFIFWVAIGNEQLLTYCFLGFAALTGVYLIYSDWHRKMLQTTLVKTAQSVEEFAVDNPAAAKILKDEYLAENITDREHLAVVEKAKGQINTTYVDKVVAAKLQAPS